LEKHLKMTPYDGSFNKKMFSSLTSGDKVVHCETLHEPFIVTKDFYPHAAPLGTVPQPTPSRLFRQLRRLCVV